METYRWSAYKRERERVGRLELNEMERSVRTGIDRTAIKRSHETRMLMIFRDTYDQYLLLLFQTFFSCG